MYIPLAAIDRAPCLPIPNDLHQWLALADGTNAVKVSPSLYTLEWGLAALIRRTSAIEIQTLVSAGSKRLTIIKYTVERNLFRDS